MEDGVFVLIGSTLCGGIDRLDAKPGRNRAARRECGPSHEGKVSKSPRKVTERIALRSIYSPRRGARSDRRAARGRGGASQSRIGSVPGAKRHRPRRVGGRVFEIAGLRAELAFRVVIGPVLWIAGFKMIETSRIPLVMRSPERAVRAARVSRTGSRVGFRRFDDPWIVPTRGCAWRTRRVLAPLAPGADGSRCSRSAELRFSPSLPRSSRTGARSSTRSPSAPLQPVHLRRRAFPSASRADLSSSRSPSRLELIGLLGMLGRVGFFVV